VNIFTKSICVKSRALITDGESKMEVFLKMRLIKGFASFGLMIKDFIASI